MKSLSIVIPVFNAEKSLNSLYKRLKSLLEKERYAFEIIMVEDCSADRSWEIISEIASQDDRIKGIQLMRNFGQHNALLCGIRNAKNDIIVTLDDDLQNPPEEIPKLIEELNKGYDVVYGKPQKEQHGLCRDMASQLTKIALQKSMGAQTARSISAFRAFRTQIRDAFINYDGVFVSIDVLLTWGTSKFIAIPVKHERRVEGTSNYTLKKLIVHTLNMVTGFSTFPLQLAGFIGFIFTFVGFGVLIYVVGRWFVLGSVVPGFAFLASIIAIFAGAQLFSLGIIGEYLAGMHFRSMKRPSYVVRTLVSESES